MNSRVRVLVGVLALAVLLIGGCSGKPGTSTPPEGNATQPQEVEILVNGNSTTISGIDLPINRTEAETIVRESCGAGNQSGYEYALMEEVDGEWRIPISNSTPPCYATVNETTGETNCSYTEPEEVIVTTDKTEYMRGEAVNISIKNNLAKTIWYEDEGEPLNWSCLSYPTQTRIEKFEDGQWEGMKSGGSQHGYTTGYGELSSGENIIIRWDQVFWQPAPAPARADYPWFLESNGSVAEEGKYRLAFAYSFAAENWEESTIVYSNNFTITSIPFKPSEVTITTNKTEYEQGEKVKITILNNLDENITYYDAGGNLPQIWSCFLTDIPTRIQKFENGEWEGVQIYYWVCSEPVGPGGGKGGGGYSCALLKPKEQVTLWWDQTVSIRGKSGSAAPGEYRFCLVYCLGENCYGDKQSTYSNNFTILAAT